MKKLLAAAACVAAILAPVSSTMAAATPLWVCTSYSRGDADIPSGWYIDEHGRRWMGFTVNGRPPESLVASGSSSTSCKETEAEDE